MKTKYNLLLLFITVTSSFGTCQAALAEEANLSNIKIEMPPTETTSSWDQMITLEFGSFKPASVQVSNGTYRFNYGSNISSYMGKAGWALKLFEFGGAFYAEESFGFSSLSGNAVDSSGATPSSSSYSMNLFGFDTRLMYAADWFPVKQVIPFVDGGYQYTIYYQPGSSSGLDSASGGVGNAVASAGLRFWLNRAASLSGNHPLYLLGDVNRVFASNNSVDLTSTSVFGGLSFGL